MNTELLAQLKKVTEEELAILNGSDRIEKQIYSNTKDFTIRSNKMLEKGKLIDVRTHTRFIPFPKHRHDYIEIIYMCNGSTTHIINSQEKIVLKKGELLILNQYAYHEIEAAGSEDIAVNFIVLPQFLDVALEMLGGENIISRFIISSLREEHDELGYMYFQVADVLPVQNLIENMVWSLVNKKDYRNIINQTTMGLLFMYLADCIDRININDNISGRDRQTVMRVIAYIDENYKTASLNEMAFNENMSISTLSRLIKEYTGRNFSQLLLEKRFAKAAKLLKDTTLAVSDIVTAVGYDNNSYFYRVFKEMYNVSPKEYRRLSKSDDF